MWRLASNVTFGLGTAYAGELWSHHGMMPPEKTEQQSTARQTGVVVVGE